MGAGCILIWQHPCRPLAGAVWLWLWMGGDAAPPDSAPLVIRPQGAPHLPSNQQISTSPDWQHYLKSAHVHTPNSYQGSLVITASRKAARVPPLSLITKVLESQCLLPLLLFSVFSHFFPSPLLGQKKIPKRCLYLGVAIIRTQ